MTVQPYYEDDACTIYHGDWRGVVPDMLAADCFPLASSFALTDPPYGIGYQSGWPRLEGNARSIRGDTDTSERDDFLRCWHPRPALVFGSIRRAAPGTERMTLVWDQGGALGMGDLSLPWKPSYQLIHVCGGPWVEGRDSGAVLRHPPVQSVGRFHPHQKPVTLLRLLIEKSVGTTVLDPFMGSGSTLRAAKDLGRKTVGIEIDERYCEIAARRLAQEVLPLGAS